jgi:hypothetical protein
VELQIEEAARARVVDETNGVRATGREELKPDLEDANLSFEALDPRLSLGEARHVERQDETITRAHVGFDAC